jgi:cytochrome c oxidase subunit 2
VFIIIQVLLFYFAYQYRNRKGITAIYYHDNSKLETIWTIVPAITMAIIVSFGVTVWHNIHNPDIKGKKPLEIELVGEQFQWRIRYAGKDGVLGKHAFKKITADNPVGVDSADKASADDVIPTIKEMHFPVNEVVQFKIRSKDVLHGVFAPHFRVNIYAVPGMPTQFTFTPTKTTEQMRKETGNPNFNYELACSQLCGSSHYNMRVVIVVDTPDEYQKWLATQPTLMGNAANLATATPAAPASTTEPAAAQTAN